MLSARERPWVLVVGVVLAILAVIVPFVVPALLPATASRSAVIGTVIAAESVVLLAIAISWVALRSARSRMG